MKKPSLLFFHIGSTSFVRKDIALLSERYAVTSFHFDTKEKKKIPLRFLAQFFFLLRKARSAEIFVCFFAGYHSFLPAVFGRLMSKPVHIILGGADCYSYPEFGYGHLVKPVLAWFTCRSASMATMLLPVDESLMLASSSYFKPDHKQGIRHHCQDLRTPHLTIPLEYDGEIFKRRGAEKTPLTFLTVGFGIGGSNFYRKGIDLVLEAATLFPEGQFTILGAEAKQMKVPIPDNVRFLAPVPYESLPEIYSQHRFYLQISIAEGFPSAICEAMLCECVPVGSPVAAIPEIIGNTGFLLPQRDGNLLAALLKEVGSRDDLEKLGREARSRIQTRYAPGSRSAVLFKVMNPAG